MYLVKKPNILKISPHLWMIQGENEAKFPSGNAFFLKTAHHLILIDTNPSMDRIHAALQLLFDATISHVTDIILSHVHLDHSHNLTQIFEASGAFLYSHSDSLFRCEKSTRIGLHAGVPSKDVHYFVEFGKYLLFEDRSYPKSVKRSIDEGTQLKFDEVIVIAHISHGHALNALDFEVFDGDIKIRLSFDYDFSYFPWYGVPFRKESLDEFISYTRGLLQNHYDWILSSHRLLPIASKDVMHEFEQYQQLIQRRTNHATELVKKSPNCQIILKDCPDFAYPIRKMVGRFPQSYIRCAEIWDKWLLLTHLEDAWSKRQVQCVDADHDPFLRQNLIVGQYLPKANMEEYAVWWSYASLKEKEMNTLPWNSRWKCII